MQTAITEQGQRGTHVIHSADSHQKSMVTAAQPASVCLAGHGMAWHGMAWYAHCVAMIVQFDSMPGVVMWLCAVAGDLPLEAGATPCT